MSSGNTTHIAVLGSVNLDLAARVQALPRPGETVTNAILGRHPGGKGANQALAARRLGARVSLLACVGADSTADEALALLRAEGVDLSRVAVDEEVPTGLAMIAVAADGENQIVVAPGANRRLTVERLHLPDADALLCQLEVPVPALMHAAENFLHFFCLNLAPVMEVPDALLRRADLIVVNEIEAGHFAGSLQQARGYVATTFGRRGAHLHRNGELLAEAEPPQVKAVDTTGAGDTFSAALTLALVEGLKPQAALSFACAAAAASTRKAGAQPAMPTRDEVDALMGG